MIGQQLVNEIRTMLLQHFFLDIDIYMPIIAQFFTALLISYERALLL